MKGRSSRLPSVVAAQDDWVDESWTVDCGCGVNFDDGEEMVNCDECGVWVHTRCSRYVKDDAMFSCDKCKSRNSWNESEENEVAQLLVDLPTKTMRTEKSNPLRHPAMQAVRPWADMPIEERVHVHGIPGGDHSLFEGLSSVFSRELWKCTGHVPKKFKFKYQGFTFWDGGNDGVEKNDRENHINEEAGLLFSLYNDVSGRSKFELPRMGVHGGKQEESNKLEIESVDIRYKPKVEEKCFVLSGSLTFNDHEKLAEQRPKERNGKKKVNSMEKECYAKTERSQNIKTGRKGIKADNSLNHSATTHLKEQNFEICSAGEEGFGKASDCLNDIQNNGSRSGVLGHEDLLPVTKQEVTQGKGLQKSNLLSAPASTLPIVNVKKESKPTSRCSHGDEKAEVIQQITEVVCRYDDHISEICKPDCRIDNIANSPTYSLFKQELDSPDSSLSKGPLVLGRLSNSLPLPVKNKAAISRKCSSVLEQVPSTERGASDSPTGSSLSKYPLVLGGLPDSSPLPMKTRTAIPHEYCSFLGQVPNAEHGGSDKLAEDNNRRATSRKTAKEHSISLMHCMSSEPHVNQMPQVYVSDIPLPESTGMVASSSAPATHEASVPSGDSDSAVVDTSEVEMRAILPHEVRIPVSGLPRSSEKVSQSNILKYSRGNSTPFSQSNCTPNAPASLSDEELALLLHQELNSSPRVPRVPRMRHSGSLPQFSPSTVPGMIIKRSSDSIKDNAPMVDGTNKRKGGEEGEEEEEGQGRVSFGECRAEVKKEEMRGCSPHLEEFPKGKRKARKRRKLILRGGTRTLLMMDMAEAGVRGEGVELSESDHETEGGGSETTSSINCSSRSSSTSDEE